MNIGDLVKGKINVGYSVTDEFSINEVINVISNREIEVEVIGHVHENRQIGKIYVVEIKKMELTTIEEFKAKFTDFFAGDRFNELEEGGKPMATTLVMDKTTIGSYKLTEEEKSILREQIITLTEKYDWNSRKKGVDAVIDEWEKNNGWMINLFKKHPKYNGKYQIVLSDSEYYRPVDKYAISDFADWLYYNADSALVPAKKGCFTYKEVTSIYEKVNRAVIKMADIMCLGYSTVRINGKTYDELRAEKTYWYDKLSDFDQAFGDNAMYYYDGESYTIESYKTFKKIREIREYVRSYHDALATEDIAARLNAEFPKLKAVKGQKIARIIRKLCKITGIDKQSDFEKAFAKYSDAVNPKTEKKVTVLSCHPVDYLTMSFGNSWASCQTIDKRNRRNKPNNYSGGYCSGTVSYMLDDSSFVYYVLDKDYNGNEPELQDKINRCMFHIGQDKLIQGRVYPQANDSEGGIYSQIRTLAQETINKCLEKENTWTVVKGTSECSHVTISCGTHYRDYQNFSNCNVSYIDNGMRKNRAAIIIGHKPICLGCGKTHSYQDRITCGCKEEVYVTCAHCGREVSTEYAHRIDDEWYCTDHSYYCEYHRTWETGEDRTYIDSYGNVCNQALDEDSNFYQCEHCGEWHYGNSRYDERITTESGIDFCCSDCARRAGYKADYDYCWYPEEQVYFCEHCLNYFHVSEWDSEHECCLDCASEIVEEEAV